MAMLYLDISVSLDGYVAGPEPSMEDPLGIGGEQLHEWAIATKAFQEIHGRDGGEAGPDDEIMREPITNTGATIMGRGMFSGGAGAWEDDPKAGGWWGDEPPFHHPVFVLTHHEREPLELTGTTFTFITGGIESALEQARAAAGERDVAIGGGADVARQYLEAGLVEQLQLHVAPVLLGSGARLLDGFVRRFENVRTQASPSGVAHLKYRVG
jgi:dihydrofolate reductase